MEMQGGSGPKWLYPNQRGFVPNGHVLTTSFSGREPTICYTVGMRGRTTQKLRTPFGERLASARLSAGLSQQAFARKLGVDRTVVRHNERSVADPKLNFVLSCCSALGIRLDELIATPCATRREYSPLLERLGRELRKLNDKEQRAVLRIALTSIRAISRMNEKRL
jgi:transcriptional regulator with XRE-family HTH domain